jgi:predicted RNase H-like nuclease
VKFVGVDLAWTVTGGTGLCLISDGRALESTRIARDDEIVAWLEPHVRDGAVMAIDAPLIVRNLTGRRRASS